MEEEELEELAQQPVPPQAQRVPSVGHAPADPRSNALDDANDDLTGRAPGAPLTNEQLARAAVLEQMAHGGAYRGDDTGNAARPEPDEEGQSDLNPMLVQNGYLPDPQVVRGANGMEMVVYRPMPSRPDVAPVVAFRGTESVQDGRTDVDPDQVGDAQYESNRALIDQTMAELSSQYTTRPEVTGHSLGGAIAQRTAADHPEQTGHITTFQAPGIRADQVEQIEAYNRAHPDAPLTADHFRAQGDVVPYAGEAHAPGSLHTTDIRPPEADVLEAIPGPAGAIANTADRAVRAHRGFIVTPYALQTEEGREALPGISRDPDDYYARGGLHTEALDESPHDPGRFAAETGRRAVGISVEMAEDAGDRSLAVADRGLASTNRNIDSVQTGVDTVSNVANANVDRVQDQVARVSEDSHANVDLVQDTADVAGRFGQNATDSAQRVVNNNVRDVVGDRAANALMGQTNRTVDTAQELARRGMSHANTAVDAGQGLARTTERTVNEVVDDGQRAAHSVVRSGQNLVDRGQQATRRGQQAVHEAWDWLTE